MANIGIMGGTFDPIHNGHLLLGKQAYVEYDLDCIWYMPSGQPPHKKDHKVTNAVHRLAMVQLAIEGEAKFELSDFETSREGNTYTAQTLHLLKEAYPDHRFFFIIGADSLYEIERWYHPEEILKMTHILVADRDYAKSHLSMDDQIDFLTSRYGGTIRKLHCREVDVSSEEIRQMVSRGKSIEKYVPKQVEAYILRHHLYQEVLS